MNNSEASVSKTKKPSFLTFVIIGSVILAILAAGVYFAVFYNKNLNDPYKNTFSALFADDARAWALISSANDKKASISLTGEIGQDIIPSLSRERLNLSAEFSSNADGISAFSANMGSKENLIDVQLIFAEKGKDKSIVFASNSLLGEKRIAVQLSDIKNALASSVFAPESKSKYSLPQSSYDALMSVIDNYDKLDKQNNDDSGDKGELYRAFKKISDAFIDNITFEKSKDTVKLIDCEINAKLEIAKFDGKALKAVADELVDQWQNNDELYNTVKKMLEISGKEGGEQEAPDADIMKQIDLTVTELADSLRELAGKDFKCTFTTAVTDSIFNKYFVYAEFNLVFNGEGDLKNSLEAVLRTKKDVKKSPELEIQISSVTNGEIDGEIKLNFKSTEDDKGKKENIGLYFFEKSVINEDNSAFYTVVRADALFDRRKDGDFTLEVTQKSASDTKKPSEDDLKEALKLSVAGEVKQTKNELSLSVNKIEINAGQQEPIIYDRSRFAVTLKVGNDINIPQSYREDDTLLLSLDEDQLTELLESTEEKTYGVFDKINSDISFELFKRTFTPFELSRSLIPDGFKYWAIDRKTGHLFVVADKGFEHYIYMYDTKDMTLLGQKKVNVQITCISADGGIVAYGTYEMYSSDSVDEKIKRNHTLKLLSAEDMTELEEVDISSFPEFSFPMEYDSIGNVAVDNGKIFITTKDQHCDNYLYDIESKKLLNNWGSAYRSSVAIDRKNHIVCVNESGSSGCDLYYFSTATGQELLCKNVHYSYNNDPIYFNGKAFYSYEKYYGTDGTEYTPGKLVKGRKYNKDLSLSAVVYMDDEIWVTLEVYQKMYGVTVFYLAGGTPITMIGEQITAMEKCADDRLAAILFDGTDNYFVTYSLIPGITFNSGE